MLHKGCIRDRETRELWHDYQAIVREGNRLGMSFVEYVAIRVNARAPQFVAATSTTTENWYVSACGHSHPWGAACSDWSATT
jgi:hypothetical protein